MTIREELLAAVTAHLDSQVRATRHEEDWEPERIADEILDIVAMHVLPMPEQSATEQEAEERRECGHPDPEGSGKICRRIVAPGRDYHGGGHWYADPHLDGDAVRMSTARWIVTGEQPGN